METSSAHDNADLSAENPVEVWPASDLNLISVDWPHLRTRAIIPAPSSGWDDLALTEWDLEAAAWEDFHQHSEVNLVIEGELHIKVDEHEVVLGIGDTARVPAGKLGRYWAPRYARMIAVYGPNPHGLDTSDRKYWDL